ncbi:IclR family transcriptional regulator [Halotalea alkalilenta]|uniref:IclR family transcriptional regulator n=1 Tax=Halotalea alkalilenta TaxID=376489 RepID=A0A172YBB3_9GAMM|nr:IclR family transcriptional regulator [Halotalea alkalilenta]ANF56514.1 hypothetical protein A5892_02715 [Halotalea alkalilenta]
MPLDESRTPQVQGTQTLDRSVLILNAIAEHGERGADIETLIQVTGLSRATLYRLLKSLKCHGFVRAPQRGGYRLGYALLSLGAQAGNDGGIRELSRPALMRLAERFGERFFLFVEDGYHALCLELQEGCHRTSSFTRGVGGRVLFGVGQASVALLAHLPAGQRERILNQNAPRLAREYCIELGPLNDAIKAVRRDGYTAGVLDQCLSAYTGVAVALLDPQGHPLGALSCALPNVRMTDRYRMTLAKAMHAEATLIVQRALDPQRFIR